MFVIQTFISRKNVCRVDFYDIMKIIETFRPRYVIIWKERVSVEKLLTKEKLLYKEIGQRIRQARKKKELTQEALGKRVNLTRASVTNIELGRQVIPTHILFRFCDALGVFPDKLLPDSNETENVNVDLHVDTKSYSNEELKWINKITLKR